MACETDVRVQNEYAVRCSIFSKPVCALEYVKTISSLVGASHILAVFEENNYIKVFFDEKRCVDTLMKNCLHVLGRHVNVDYVIPPGVKLILSNVDPIITNYDVIRLLSTYGTVVSPVIRPPISDDIELCHISYGVRFVYMILHGCVPEKIEFRYGEQLSSFKVNVVENADSLTVSNIKTDALEYHDEIESNSTVPSRDSLPGPSDTETDTLAITETVDPVLVSVQSVTAIISKEHMESLNPETSDITAVSKQSLPLLENTESQVDVKPRKRRGRPPGPNRKRLVAVSQAARRIKNAKRKWFGGYKRAKYGRRSLTKSTYHTLPVSSQTSNCVSMPDLVSELNDSDENDVCKVLSNKDLMKFIEEVKGHRAPLELARKYIGQNCDTKKVYKLIEQLQNFKKSHDNITLKTRIWRLNKTLIDAMTVENEN